MSRCQRRAANSLLDAKGAASRGGAGAAVARAPRLRNARTCRRLSLPAVPAARARRRLVALGWGTDGDNCTCRWEKEVAAVLGRMDERRVTRDSGVKMAMGTRNPSTRRVLPDKEVGTEGTSYPRVRYWAKSHTHRVCGYGCGCRLPIPVYPR
jgi:hypothetical protein